MPINKYDTNTGAIDQVCSNCARKNSIKFRNLVLGVEINGVPDPDVVQLQPCACGTTEGIMRTWDDAPESTKLSPFGAHRRLVNALSIDLTTAGQVHPTARREGVPPDVLPLPGNGIYKIPLHAALAIKREKFLEKEESRS